MGNFCGGNRNDFQFEENQLVHEVIMPECTIQIIKGNILNQHVKCLLNAAYQPNDHPLMQLPEMKKENLKIAYPKILRVPPGSTCFPDFLINLRINPNSSSKEELIEAYENAFSLVGEHELDSVAFRENQQTSITIEQLLYNCQCFIEAIFSQIRQQTSISKIIIVDQDHKICQIYKNELKKQHTLFLRSLYQTMQPSNFYYGDILDTINEQTEKNSEIGNTLLFNDRIKLQRLTTASVDIKENLSPIIGKQAFSTGGI